MTSLCLGVGSYDVDVMCWIADVLMPPMLPRGDLELAPKLSPLANLEGILRTRRYVGINSKRSNKRPFHIHLSKTYFLASRRGRGGDVLVKKK